tara:strand:- start:7184 stop:7480 length:297 start_codon:yes stop_codon:yes gene_type:complete
MAENNYEPKPGEGSVFANDRKEEDWHADWRGRILLPDGTTHWLDVYDNISKGGVPYKRVRIGNAVQSASSNTSAPVQNNKSSAASVENISELTDDVPF